MSLIKSTIIPPIKTIFKIYFLGLLFFSSFRFLLFLNEFKHIDSVPDSERIAVFFQSFIMGIRFDLVITGYISILPAFLLILLYQFNIQNQFINKFLKIYFGVLFGLSFLICGIDISYFHHFFSRFTVNGFVWADNTSFMLKMIFQEFAFWWVIFPIVFSILLFIWIINRWIFNASETNESIHFTSKFRIQSVVVSLVALLLIFIGIRGRLESKSPIRVGTAYFSNYAFPNQLGLNPVFTLLRSYLDSRKEKGEEINLIENQSAIEQTQKYINRKGNEFSPIYEYVSFDSTNERPPNIVLVIMESMSASKMARFGNTDKLTPFLDSIAKTGYSFDNIYSAGTHTFNGIFSTLFSFPALFTKHPMKSVEIPKFNGIASVLKANNYSTAYFTTHDDQFDNVGGFLKGNDYDLIISQQDYPNENVKSTLGVPDDFMFEFSIPQLNRLYNKNNPFFAVMMTASDHGPYVVPEYFNPKHSDEKKSIVEYADWSLKKLVELSKKEKWFNNTLFVFVADHGSYLDAKFDVPLSYNHIPFIIYAPLLISEPKSFSNFGSQIDVFPTVMNLVKLPYENYTLGIDLFNHTRPYTYFCNDDKLAVIDSNFLYVYRKNSTSSLYKLNQEVAKDCINQFPEIASGMKNYAFSQIQTADYLIKNKKLSKK